MSTRSILRPLLTVVFVVSTLMLIGSTLNLAKAKHPSPGSIITCAGSIQACIDAASDGDTIVIPAGTYTESLTLSKPVSLTGVNSTTTIIHAVANQRVITVTGATISNSVVISGLTFTGGSADNGGGVLINDTAQPLIQNVIITHNIASAAGGGIYAEQGSPLVVNNAIVISNTAKSDGGGAYISGQATMTNTQFISNSASGKGGGAAVSTVDINGGRFEGNVSAGGYGGGGLSALVFFMTGTEFISNDAPYAGGGAQAGYAFLNGGRFENNVTQNGGGGGLSAGQVYMTGTVFISNTSYYGGGGLYASPFGAVIVGGRFENNHTIGAQHAEGGGLSAFVSTSQGATVFITATQFLNNTATDSGGGAYISGMAQLIGTQFIGNSSDTSGGGLFASDIITLTNTNFLNNIAQQSGGGLSANDAITLTNVQFISNTANSNGGGGGGGGVYSYNGSITLVRGQFESNVSHGYGGGLFREQCCEVFYMTDTEFISNTAIGSNGGGGAFVAGHSIISGGRFERNVSTSSGGGGFFGVGDISGTMFISNSANAGGGFYGWGTIDGAYFEANQSAIDDYWLGGGGALATIYGGATVISNTKFVNNFSATRGGAVFAGSEEGVTIINSLFSRNTANADGAAISDVPYLAAGGSLTILHATIADVAINTVSAIAIYHRTVGITDTIVASHTIGISNMGGTVYEDYNLYFGNITNTIGVTSGGHSLIGDPRFVDPSHDDYHLRRGSAAIDHGVDAGVYTDLDGSPRPIGAGFDIGAYEFQSIKRAYLSVILK